MRGATVLFQVAFEEFFKKSRKSDNMSIPKSFLQLAAAGAAFSEATLNLMNATVEIHKKISLEVDSGPE